MAKFLFIGGIENSGKTFISQKFEEIGYKRFCLDNYFEKIVYNHSILINDLRKNNKILLKFLVDGISNRSIYFEEKDIINLYQSIENGKYYMQQIDNLSIRLMLQDMKKIGKNENIVFDSLLLNKYARQYYNDLFYRTLVGKFFGFANFKYSTAEKTLIYIDETLDNCLNRLEQTQKIKPYVDKERIIENFNCQQIPGEDELPNTKIIVLKNNYNLDEILNQPK
jgi:hypothetical protein